MMRRQFKYLTCVWNFRVLVKFKMAGKIHKDEGISALPKGQQNLEVSTKQVLSLSTLLWISEWSLVRDGEGRGEHVRRQAICCWMCPSCVTLRMALQLYSTFYIRETKHQLNYKRKVIELHSGTFNESHPKYRAWAQKPKQLNWSTLSPSPFTSRVTVNCVSQVPWKGNESTYSN